MASESEHVTAFAVEASSFPDLVQQYRISGVPVTIVNEETEILGALPEEAFVSQALEKVTGDNSQTTK
jgi:predicted DsbA family dithiol-disulfide isomerase